MHPYTALHKPWSWTIPRTLKLLMCSLFNPLICEPMNVGWAEGDSTVFFFFFFFLQHRSQFKGIKKGNKCEEKKSATHWSNTVHVIIKDDRCIHYNQPTNIWQQLYIMNPQSLTMAAHHHHRGTIWQVSVPVNLSSPGIWFPRHCPFQCFSFFHIAQLPQLIHFDSQQEHW